LNECWPIRDEDREFFAREVDTFLPDRIFDAHCHLYRTADFGEAVPPLAASGPPIAGWKCFIEHMEAITPQRRYSALAFPFPVRGLDAEAANDFVAAEAAAHRACIPQMLVTPWMDPEFIRSAVRRHGFVGLKCYHCFSPVSPTFESQIEDFLPESQVRVAHEEGLSITLHMVRRQALADPANQSDLRRLSVRYPNARWILAHAARGFNVHHTISGIESLRGLTNMWFDTSAVTEAGAFEAIVRVFGYERLLYGADFPVTHIRGRCVAIGDSFLWLDETNTRFEAAYGPIRPVLVLLESLRALRLAMWNLAAHDRDIERVFWRNAADLYGQRVLASHAG
jgi:predicted TIM-barrel fold metal-dependent hydrolase